MYAGAKAFEWKQEFGINQARRTGEIAVFAANSTAGETLQPKWCPLKSFVLIEETLPPRGHQCFTETDFLLPAESGDSDSVEHSSQIQPQVMHRSVLRLNLSV